jgi:glycosyltransferase involved in cell wall biosynthesis
LAGVHRARLWAQHLPEFDWEPIVVTAHPAYYKERLDPALLEIVSPGLRVIRTKALPLKPLRLVGDIGMRALWWQLKALESLVVRKEIDFIHITIPSNYLALLGELLYRRYQFPFGIDYQDPWVHMWPDANKPFSRAWMSSKLAKWLEPWAVKNAVLITGVAPLYYEPVFERNPRMREQCVTCAMPIGNSQTDYQLLREKPRDTFLFSKDDGLFHMVYAGAMLPKAYEVLERFLEALALLRESEPGVIERVRIHFVGTGSSTDDPESCNVRPHVERFGLEPWVYEYPNRISYMDVLNHLTHASAILILGSTEPHYTPSKFYQAVASRRPIFALLHKQSTAVTILRENRVGEIVTLTENRLPDASELALRLAKFVRDPQYAVDQLLWHAFEAYSARNSARLLASAVDRALELFDRRRAHKILTTSSFPSC